MGVNKYSTGPEEKIEMQDIDESAVSQQLQRLKEFKQNRDNDVLQSSLAALKSATSTDENLMPHIIHAVKAHATLGEISDTLRSVFGEY